MCTSGWYDQKKVKEVEEYEVEQGPGDVYDKRVNTLRTTKKRGVKWTEYGGMGSIDREEILRGSEGS